MCGTLQVRRTHILPLLLGTSAVLLAQQLPDPGPDTDPQFYAQQYPPPPYPQQTYSQQIYPYPQQPQPQTPEPPDQPGQPVARLGVINGEASVRRADSGDWVAAVLNAPLMAGDSISVAPSGSTELQLDYANFLRIGGDSEVRISQLDGTVNNTGRQQVQVSRGLVTWRVLRDDLGANPQSEISTPSVAVHPGRLSEVRVEVAIDGSTRIIVRRGEAEVVTPKGSERIREGNMMLVRGTPDDAEFQVVYAPAKDGWDSFNDQRDAYLDRAQSNVSRYVSPDIYGDEDLSVNGTWGYDPAYGSVWTPNVPPTWAPYQNGQWDWEDYYGWTWVNSDPWGWAPFHYGSWYNRTGFGWTWFPGPRSGRYWYHPALVGFFGFGGTGFGAGFGFGNIGWVALAPYEVFHPWYGPGWYAGRFAPRREVIYNASIVNSFRNARAGNGVVAVSAADFERGAFRNQISVYRAQLAQGSLVRGALPVAPTASNLRFSDLPVAAASIPRNEAAHQRFFSRMPAAAPAQRNSFAQQQASIRNAFAPAPRASAPTPAADSGWSRFGTPGTGGGLVQPRPAQSSGENRAPGWNGFGGELPNQGERSVQVAPPIVQQRAAPAPAPTYRSAHAPSNRGSGGGNRSSGGHNGGGHR